MVRYVLRRGVGYLESFISENDLFDSVSLKCDQALRELKRTKKNLLNIIDENENFDFEIIIEDKILVRGLTAIISCELNNQLPLNEKDERLDQLNSILFKVIKSDIILNLQSKVLDQLDVKVPKNYLNIPYLKDLLITGKIAKLILSKLHTYDEFKAISEILHNDIKDNEVFSLPHFIIYIYSIKDKQLKEQLPSYKINTNIMKLKYTKSDKIDNYKERKIIVDHISECQIFFKLFEVLNDLEEDGELEYDYKILIVYLFNSFSQLVEVKFISNILSNNRYSGAEYLSESIKLENTYDEVYQKYLNEKYDLKKGNVLFPSNFYTSKNFLFKFYLAEIFSSLIVLLPNLIEFYDELINKFILEIEKNFKSKKNEQLNGKEILFDEEYLSKIFNFIFDDEMVSVFLNMKSRDWNKEQSIITCCYKEAYKANHKKTI